MPKKQALKSRNLDKIDKKILMILQDNARESLTNIAKKVGLGIDSVHNRIKALTKKEIVFFQGMIDPRKAGFDLISDIKIKLHKITEEQRNKFIAYLTEHPRVTTVLAIMGDYDLTIVMIAKNTAELEQQSIEIRQKYNELIADWSATLVLKTYKFEEYELE